MRKSWTFVVLWIISLGCVRAPTVPVSSGPLPVPTPSLEKTFGEIHFSEFPSSQITYKNISLIIDPTLLGSAANLKADYILFTKVQSSWSDAASLHALDPSQKIIVPASEGERFVKSNFQQTKALQGNQKVLLKKDNNFLFVTAVQMQDSASKKTINGYCLEFDNGKNIFISGGITDMTVLRPFLYDLRDDGKEIYLALISGDQTAFVELISLFQPRLAVVQMNSKSTLDMQTLRQPLADAFFQGQLLTADPNSTIPF